MSREEPKIWTSSIYYFLYVCLKQRLQAHVPTVKRFYREPKTFLELYTLTEQNYNQNI